MKLMPIARTLLFMSVCSPVAPMFGAQETSPDNTKVNKRDRDKSTVTADQQKENDADRKITQQIRQAIVKDKSLSTYGHNVKVITQNGTVTLRGPVRSEEEKKTIESRAEEIAGKGNVKSEIEIKPANTK